MLRAIIIEDEYNARETLKILLSKYCDNVDLVGEAIDVKSGLECIKNCNPDLVFLDIEMPDGDGFELLRKLNGYTFDIIFTTAYSEFAVQAFKYNTIDYLLKPIVHEELIKSVDKAERQLQTKDLSKKFSRLLAYINSGGPEKRIVLATREKYNFVNIAEIIMCKADKNYTTFYMENGKNITTSKTLKEYNDVLLDSGFFRPHRQYIVNMKHVQSFERINESVIKMTHDFEVPVSSRNRDRLIEMINQI
ncbi:MAG: LytTR family DNA-binding domain-containing protein [Bacteroidales bacterium]|nr:LytTR family DNA-binding domain-containing protein [Bacteroidales bacterium]